MENCDDYPEKFEILSGWQIILIMYYFMNIYNAISSDVSMHSNRLRFLVFTSTKDCCAVFP